jgi:hypothetical protein
MRLFKTSDLQYTRRDQTIKAQIRAQRFLVEDRIQWLDWSKNREHGSRSQATLPIEIDGGEDWIRLALFGTYNSYHYVVDVDLHKWTTSLVGFFNLVDKLDCAVGLVEWDDPNVEILRELKL